MEKANIKTGAKATIIVTKLDQTKLELPTIFESYITNSQLMFYAPIVGGKLFSFRRGQGVVLEYFYNNGTNSFEAKFVSDVKKGNMNFVVVEQVSDVKRIQKRNDFRLDINMKLKVKYKENIVETVTEDNHQIEKIVKQGKEIFENVTTTDISGGGISFITDSVFQREDKMTMFIRLTEKDLEEEFHGTVMRITKLDPDIAKLKYNVGVRFDYTTPHQKDKIVRYCFEKQREQNRLKK